MSEDVRTRKLATLLYNNYVRSACILYKCELGGCVPGAAAALLENGDREQPGILQSREEGSMASTATTILYLLHFQYSVLGQEDATYIYGNSNSYSSYFPAPIDFGEQWRLHIHTTRFGEDFIAFFASDTDRQGMNCFNTSYYNDSV